MNPSTAKTNRTESSEVKQAEREVQQSTAEFETAMDRLDAKIGDTTSTVQRTVYLAKNPKQLLAQAVSKARTTATPYVDRGRLASQRILSRAQDSSRQLSTRMKENPKPFVAGALTLAGLIAGGIFLSKRKARTRSEVLIVEETVIPEAAI